MQSQIVLATQTHAILTCRGLPTQIPLRANHDPQCSSFRAGGRLSGVAKVNVKRLFCPIQPYAWGSHNFISELQGRASPTTDPEAELWMGAHPTAPSQVQINGERLSLDDVIARDRVDALGGRVVERFGGELPFLLKVLAAERPLSLQAHPSRAQAEAGFAAEEAAGIPLSDAFRNYKDRRHKPELIVALTPFVALCGFRHVPTTRRLFDKLAVARLDRYLAPLRAGNPQKGLRETCALLFSASRHEQVAIVESVLEAGRRLASDNGEFEAELGWAVRLGGLYPGDIGVVVALLLNLVRLQPHQALYLSAGNLHSYLSGAGVEIMANSDNVLRGGLTPKRIDVPGLLRVLEFSELEPSVLSPLSTGGAEAVYSAPAEDFRLSCLSVAGGVNVTDRDGPEIVLATEGSAMLASGSETIELQSGTAAFVPASAPPYSLAGTATVFRATVPLR